MVALASLTAPAKHLCRGRQAVLMSGIHISSMGLCQHLPLEAIAALADDVKRSC